MLRILGGIFLYLISTIVILAAGLFGALKLAVDGPSEHFRDVFVSSMMESSAGPVLIRLVMPENDINAILDQNRVIATDEITDTTLINIMHNESDARTAQALSDSGQAANGLDPDGDGIDLYEISGPMYHGAMMVVYDPSRVIVATIDDYSHSSSGMTLPQLIDKYGAVAGINGGQYEDRNGLGIGGWPLGVVISEGVLRQDEYAIEYLDNDGNYEIRTPVTCGFTEDDVLVVGSFNGSAAQEMGLRDALSFGPALIVNGVAGQYNGSSGGLNPRTAIGQREDGAVLLLVIEGRKSSSMGATMADLIDVMLEYGAVNAFNLDGGMSSSMWYNGEEIINNAQIRSERSIPTAFVVLPKQEGDPS